MKMDYEHTRGTIMNFLQIVVFIYLVVYIYVLYISE